ncbi:hypothetical protein [Kordiimonas sp.]|uniref:hypothetical protein n=1 Tax=Kordiimonas sp. TaxID=1970157 RepID=UPI003A8EBC8A
MKIFVLVCAVLVTSLPVQAQEQGPAEAVVHALFDAMRAGDGAAARALVKAGAPLERLQADGTVKAGSFEKWTAWIDEQAPGDADEQIFAVKTFHSTAGLATVAAPFVIYYKGELVGCGVNQFSLALTSDGWRIIHGIDVPYAGDCATYRDMVEGE